MDNEEMYRCKVEATDTGMVIASVFAPDGRRVGLEFFTGWDFFGVPPDKLEKRMIAARRWAHKHADVCRRGEGFSNG